MESESAEATFLANKDFFPLNGSSLRASHRRSTGPFAPPPPSASSGLGSHGLKYSHPPTYPYRAGHSPSASSLASASTSAGYRGSGSSRTSFSSLSATSDIGSVRSERASWNADKNGEGAIDEPTEAARSRSTSVRRVSEAASSPGLPSDLRRRSQTGLSTSFDHRNHPVVSQRDTTSMHWSSLPSPLRRASESLDLRADSDAASIPRPRIKGRSASDVTGIQTVLELTESRSAQHQSHSPKASSSASARQEAQIAAKPLSSRTIDNDDDYTGPLRLVTPQLEGALRSLQEHEGHTEMLAILSSHLSEDDESGRASTSTLSMVRDAFVTTRKGLQRLASKEDFSCDSRDEISRSIRARRGLPARSASVDHVLQCADGHSLSVRLPREPTDTTSSLSPAVTAKSSSLRAAARRLSSTSLSSPSSLSTAKSPRRVLPKETEQVEYLAPQQSPLHRNGGRRKSMPHLQLLPTDIASPHHRDRLLGRRKLSVPSIAEAPSTICSLASAEVASESAHDRYSRDGIATVVSAPASRITFDNSNLQHGSGEEKQDARERELEKHTMLVPLSAPPSGKSPQRGDPAVEQRRERGRPRRGASADVVLEKALPKAAGHALNTVPSWASSTSRTLARKSFSALRNLLGTSGTDAVVNILPPVPLFLNTECSMQAASDASGHVPGSSGGGGDYRGAAQGASGGWNTGQGGARSGGSSFPIDSNHNGGSTGGGGSGSGGGSGGGPPNFSPTNSRSDPPVQSLFRRLELVGRGAYGAVYRGVHVATGSVVALKVVNLDTPDDDVTGIQQEVALLSQLRDADQRNVVRYWGCWMKGPEIWIVMDFAEGGSIRTLMKSGPIHEKYIVLIVRETLIALQYLHRSAIIHRDIKAANILLTNTGRILLCDFGVAASLASSSVHAKRTTFVGTPYWMAPEVITKGKTYDQRADIWSLGITIYEIATGNPPLADQDQMRVIMLIPKSKPPRLPSDGEFSPGLRDFVTLCLNEEANERPTAEELAKSKWIKASAKTPNLVLRELIAQYVAWTKSGGMRMSLLGAEAADLGDAGNRDSFAFDGNDDAEDWEFGTIRSRLDSNLYEGFDSDLSAKPAASTPQRDHPLLRLFDQGMSDEDLIGGTGFRGFGMPGREASPAATSSSNTPITSTVRPGAYVAERPAPAPPTTSATGPTNQGALSGAGSFAGSGTTPFRFGGGGGAMGSNSPAPRSERPSPISIPVHQQGASAMMKSPYDMPASAQAASLSRGTQGQLVSQLGSRRQMSYDSAIDPHTESVADTGEDSLSSREEVSVTVGNSTVTGRDFNVTGSNTARVHPHQRTGSTSASAHRRDLSNISNQSGTQSSSSAYQNPASESGTGRHGTPSGGQIPHARKGSRNAMIVPANWQSSAELGEDDASRDSRLPGMERAASSAGEMGLPPGISVAPTLDRALSDQAHPMAIRSDANSAGMTSKITQTHDRSGNAQMISPSAQQHVRSVIARTALQPMATSTRGGGGGMSVEHFAPATQGYIQQRSAASSQTRLAASGVGATAGDDLLPPSPMTRFGGGGPVQTASEALVENTASQINGTVPHSAALQGPPLRPLDLSLLSAKEDVYLELARTVDELGKWLDVVGAGLDNVAITGSGTLSNSAIGSGRTE